MLIGKNTIQVKHRTYSITKAIARLQDNKRDHTIHITRAIVAQAVVVQDRPKMLVTPRVT